MKILVTLNIIKVIVKEVTSLEGYIKNIFKKMAVN